MAHPAPQTLTPSELAYLAEMELVTVIPRQRLDPISLLSGTTPPLRPPHPASLPLWLALLLSTQRRADIIPPPWLSSTTLEEILDDEIALSHARDANTDTTMQSQPQTQPQSQSQDPNKKASRLTSAPSLPAPSRLESSSAGANAMQDMDSGYGPYLETTPPFAPTSVSTAHANRSRSGASEQLALPYHYLELSTLILSTPNVQNIPDAEAIRRLIRDIREVRSAKIRAKLQDANGGAGLDVSGISALEVAEHRAFVTSVVDGMRKLGRSREEAARETALNEAENDEDDDVDMV